MAVSAILQSQFHARPEDIVLIGNGDSLFDLIRGGGFSKALLVLDLSMPGRFKRLRLVDVLLMLEPTLLIVVYTAYTSPHLAHDLLERGVKAFVTKSVSKEPLSRSRSPPAATAPLLSMFRFGSQSAAIASSSN